MLAKTKINRRQAQDFGNEPEGVGNDCAATASISATKLLLSFSGPVVLRGLPAGVTVNALAATDADQTSPTTILFTFAAPVAAGQTWAIANKEPRIRTAAGGFVAAATGTFPA